MTNVTEVGPGDYVKIGSHWEKIISNSDYGALRSQKDGNWRIQTERGTYSGWSINRYAKAEEIENK